MEPGHQQSDSVIDVLNACTSLQDILGTCTRLLQSAPNTTLTDPPGKLPLSHDERQIVHFMRNNKVIKDRYKMGDQGAGKVDWPKFSFQFERYALCALIHSKQISTDPPIVFHRTGEQLREKLKYLNRLRKRNNACE